MTESGFIEGLKKRIHELEEAHASTKAELQERVQGWLQQPRPREPTPGTVLTLKKQIILYICRLHGLVLGLADRFHRFLPYSSKLTVSISRLSNRFQQHRPREPTSGTPTTGRQHVHPILMCFMSHCCGLESQNYMPFHSCLLVMYQNQGLLKTIKFNRSPLTALNPGFRSVCDPLNTRLERTLK